VSTGSPSHLVIGRISGLRGVKGELKVEILSDFPQRFRHLKQVFLGEELAPYEVERSRLHQGVALLQLKGVEAVDAANRLIGKTVHVPLSEAVPLVEGEYYWHQVIGLEAQTTSGETLGHVTDIIRTGANDVYVVRGVDGKEILLPAIEQVIKAINPDEGKMIVELMPGL
jgi:16S rRNA processing protein RimM